MSYNRNDDIADNDINCLRQTVRNITRVTGIDKFGKGSHPAGTRPGLATKMQL